MGKGAVLTERIGSVQGSPGDAHSQRPRYEQTAVIGTESGLAQG